MEPRASAEPAQQPAGAWPAAVDDSLPPGFAPARMPAFRSAPPGGNAICLDNGVWLQLPRRYDEAAAAPGPGAPRLPRLDDVALDERLLRRRPVTSAAMAELAASGLGGGAGNVRAKRVRKHSATAAAAAAAAIADSPGGGADAFGDWEDEAGGAPARKRGRGRGRDGGDAAPVASRRRDLTWADVDDVFGPALAAPPQPPPPPPGATAAQRAWLALAHRDVPMAARAVAAARRGVAAEMLRLAEATQREVRGRVVRSVRLARSGAARLRRLMRDSASLWRRLEREVADSKRRADRDALDATRREEELLEAKRQQQRLNFLLTQTELYSHFMASKTGATPLMPPPAQPAAQPDGTAVPMEEDAETAAMAADVRARAEAAADAALAATAAFDAAVPGGAPAAAPAPAAEVAQPVMFGGTLKGYQLKGLQWLVNVYEQGLNCILADEMGLGKTAQAISFLCHLAESAGQWGPFLVVSPASTLPNWADELARFAPGLRLLPYWGASAERAALRKAFDPRRLGKPDAPFHVLVTSYQLLVSDEKHFRRVKWRYMVLDEAQAIKSASSARWKTLLSFACRNRLLLTGTPVQNTMAELWALLHFIMPTLFDSHEQFATWFSRGVEGAVNDGGALNAHQLSRLHAILKPFMLRRVKTEVEAEMAPKTEVMVSCALSARQRALYAAVKDKISIADLLSGGALSEKKTLHLMNIVIQLRKVCNHPELFERRAPRAALRFAPPPPEHSCASTAAAAAATAAATTGPASAPMGAAAPAERLRAPGLAAAEVCLRIPVLLFRDGMRALPSHASGAARSGGAALADAGAMLSIWHAAVIHAGWRGTPRAALSLDAVSERSGGAAWAFTRLVDASPAEAARLGGASRDTLGRWVEHRLGRRAAGAAAAFWAREGTASAQASRRHRPLARAALLLPERLRSLRSFSGASDAPPLLTPLATRLLRAADSLRLARCFLPAATAPPPALRCADPAVAAQQAALDADPWARWLLHAAGERVPPPAACAGAPAVARRGSEHGPMHPAAALAALRWPQRPLLAPLRAALSAELRIQAYALAHALADSGKLQALDRLLRRLSQEGHKVLIFSQMTKMLNLLEDYCRYRKWRFLRLDGSSSIAERREMVSAFQSPGDTHFVFLLSTRAGGLGINLTAADTVIFYESDWNPTMDAQAMDRAHRLGQTRPVTVYRLVCAGSVEERIVRRAQQKQAVQALVMSGAPLPEGLDAGGASDDVFAPEEVVSLLLDDAEVEAQLANRIAPKSHRAPAWGGGRRALRMDGDGVATVAAEAGGEGDDELAGGAAPAKRKAPAKPRVPRAPKAPKATGLFGTKLPQPPPMPPPMPPPPPVAEPAAAEPPPPLAEPPAKRPKVEPPAAPTPAPQPVVLAPPAPPPPAPAAAEAEAAPPPSLFKIKFKVKFTAPPPEDEEA